MICFPQTDTGAIAHFPLRRSRRLRSIGNITEAGERICLPDPAASTIEWQLSMRDLSAPEAGRITDLFHSSHGPYAPFLFVDPLANLLGWSEDLSRPDWIRGLLTITSGATDPLGTNRAATLANLTPGAQALQQSISLPGDYVASFSLWIRTTGIASVQLQRDQNISRIATGPAWRRISIGGKGTQGAAQSTFSIILPAGLSVDIWGMQVEAQPCPSEYKTTTNAKGIYEETYFATDELKMTNTGPGLFACNLLLRSRG